MPLLRPFLDGGHTYIQSSAWWAWCLILASMQDCAGSQKTFSGTANMKKLVLLEGSTLSPLLALGSRCCLAWLLSCSASPEATAGTLIPGGGPTFPYHFFAQLTMWNCCNIGYKHAHPHLIPLPGCAPRAIGLLCFCFYAYKFQSSLVFLSEGWARR